MLIFKPLSFLFHISFGILKWEWEKIKIKSWQIKQVLLCLYVLIINKFWFSDCLVDDWAFPCIDTFCFLIPVSSSSTLSIKVCFKPKVKKMLWPIKNWFYLCLDFSWNTAFLLPLHYIIFILRVWKAFVSQLVETHIVIWSMCW